MPRIVGDPAPPSPGSQFPVDASEPADESSPLPHVLPFFPPRTSLMPLERAVEQTFLAGDRLVHELRLAAQAIQSSPDVQAMQAMVLRVRASAVAGASGAVERFVPAPLRAHVSRAAAPCLRRYAVFSARQGSVLVFGIAAVVVLGLLLTLSHESLALGGRQGGLIGRSRFLIEGGGGRVERASAVDCARAVACGAPPIVPGPGACDAWAMVHVAPADAEEGVADSSASARPAPPPLHGSGRSRGGSVQLPLVTWTQLRGEAVWALHFRRGCRGSSFPVYLPNSQFASSPYMGPPAMQALYGFSAEPFLAYSADIVTQVRGRERRGGAAPPRSTSPPASQVPSDLLCAVASVAADVTAADDAAAWASAAWGAPRPTLRSALCVPTAGSSGGSGSSGGGGSAGAAEGGGDEVAADALLKRLWEARPSAPGLPVRLAQHVPALLKVGRRSGEGRGDAPLTPLCRSKRRRPPPPRCCGCCCSGARASRRARRGTPSRGCRGRASPLLRRRAGRPPCAPCRSPPRLTRARWTRSSG